MFSKIIFTFIIVAVVCFSFFPVASFAESDESNTPEEFEKFIDIGDGIYGPGNDIDAKTFVFNVGTMIRMLLSALGIALTLIIVYAGYLWSTAGGKEEQVTKARSWITNGILGLVVTLSAFAITEYVIGKLG